MAKRTKSTKALASRTAYTPQLADSICTQIIEGKSLNSICKAEGMPKISTVIRWLNLHESFSTKYARAKEDQADTLADEILAIADDVEGDPDPNSRRLRIDARKWISAHLKPRKWGDNIGLKLTDGATGGEYALTEILIGIRQETRPAVAPAPAQIVEAEK
jgi:hypothetical protein